MQKKNTFNLDTEKLYNQYKPKTIEDVQEILKSQTKDLIEKILQEEMKNYLGYDRYEHLKKQLKIITETVHMIKKLDHNLVI
ncbi:hypothetical protein NWE59_00755 [Mycoplasmopsis felis]|uniref:hypothetical protein n=1 Tax=Mycoplasmopsis felis TaxID=33923 RepID=UPI0021AE6DCE|nr:hypothetical protein [Mycoplasmopsis felis]UWV78655.1 hypothetical protein NWE59_00755 [Mycoplasmopsis felis]